MIRKSWMICLLPAVLALLLQQETQVLINVDELPTGYGPWGAEYVVRPDGRVRSTVPHQDGEDGWGPVVGYSEDYLDGNAQLPGCNVPVNVVLGDFDLDGDVDLADFAEFQDLFVGANP
jgi:hypothetical protein